MACPRCGERCVCAPSGEYAGVRNSNPELTPTAKERQMGFVHSSIGGPTPGRQPARTATNSTGETQPAHWRDEVASRVQAHRARRKRKFDPDTSLSLGFETSTAVMEPVEEEIYPEALVEESAVVESPSEPSHTYDVMAAENAEPAFAPTLAPALPPAGPTPDIYERMAAKAKSAPPVEREADSEGNIIEFPRSASVQIVLHEELAEPMSAPRILDVPEEPAAPEVAATLPPLATVRLDEGMELPEWAMNYEEEEEDPLLPLQVAPMGPRMLCGVMDAVLVLTAAALFSLIVLSMAKFVPQGKIAAVVAILLPVSLWALYQYVFLVYGGSTPGMLMAQLELSSFEGCVPMQRTRASRAVAMMLSCASLGLGFAWALLDEDSLGWHDRITRTYLRQS